MTSPERVYKVALFGVTGCGKSSIINLLAEEPVAEVSTGGEACTRRAQWYPITLGDKKFRLWDTMGFNQAEAEEINRLSPFEQAHAVLQNMEDGVDLILLCTRKDGINASLRSLHWLLDSLFFSGQAQIALVFTHFDAPDDQWWDRNEYIIAQRCDIPARFLPRAYITTVPNNILYERSKQALKALLQEHAISADPTPLHLDLSPDNIAVATEDLNVHCQLSIPDAQKLVETFLKSPKRPFHVILFGEAGAGKSSVINLVLDELKAPISSGLGSSTLESKSYRINTGTREFFLWDTVSFNGVHIGHGECATAMESAVHLIRDLHKRGGVDLLVFCRREGRFMPSELSGFRLFQEFLCDGQVPVAFIITHLEALDPMEKWWAERGEALLKFCNVKAARHACITSIAPEDLRGDPDLRKKRLQSKELVLVMLEDSISYSNASTEGTFAKKLTGLVKGGNPPRKEKITVKSLMGRCNLSKSEAEELVRLLYSTRGR